MFRTYRSRMRKKETGSPFCKSGRMAIPHRALLFAAATISAVLLSVSLGTGSADAAPKAFAQKSVKPGKTVNLRVKNFPKKSRVTLFLQPTKYRGGNGFGIALNRRYGVAKGRGKIRFRMPKRYYACAGASDCSTETWRRGSRVDLTVCTVNTRIPYCAVAVSRIR